MSHCHDEHDGHGHDHSEGAAHDHTDDLTPALQNHIYEQIDFSAINTLNESTPRSGTKVVQKTWTERMEPEPEVVSDADEQLLMHIPYVYLQNRERTGRLMGPQIHGADTPALHLDPNIRNIISTANTQTLRQQRQPRLLHRHRPRTNSKTRPAPI